MNGARTTYMQNTAGWIRLAGKGWIIYLSPGHSMKDFENPTYSRIVLNAVIFKP
jgi:type 1 glutamine amidotransferase